MGSCQIHSRNSWWTDNLLISILNLYFGISTCPVENHAYQSVAQSRRRSNQRMGCGNEEKVMQSIIIKTGAKSLGFTLLRRMDEMCPNAKQYHQYHNVRTIYLSQARTASRLVLCSPLHTSPFTRTHDPVSKIQLIEWFWLYGK